MQISWKGQTCFSLIISRNKQEQIKITIDPFDQDLGLRIPSLEADIVLVTNEEGGNVKAIRGDPVVVSNPGEYEIKDIFAQGIVSVGGGKGGVNTIYKIDAENMHLCHLGNLNQEELTSEQVEEIGNIDILFIPVGGGPPAARGVDAARATKIVNQIEPRVVIPMRYDLPKIKTKLDKVEVFLKTIGVKSNGDVQNKLIVRERDLTEEMKVVVLTP